MKGKDSSKNNVIKDKKNSRKEEVIEEYVQVFEVCSQMYKRMREIESIPEEQQMVDDAQMFVRKMGVGIRNELKKLTSDDIATLKKKYKKEVIKEVEVIEETEEESTIFDKLRFWASNFLFYFSIVIVIYVGYIYVNNQKESVPPQSVLGYAPMTVLTKSMDSVIPKNSLILSKSVDPNTIEIGDDITFLLEDNSTITHRVIGIYENYEGSRQRGFETQGVDNPMPDKDIVYEKNMIGKVVFHSLLLGQLLIFIRKHIIIVFILIVLTVWFIHALKEYLKMRKEERSMNLKMERKGI